MYNMTPIWYTICINVWNLLYSFTYMKVLKNCLLIPFTCCTLIMLSILWHSTYKVSCEFISILQRSSSFRSDIWTWVQISMGTELWMFPSIVSVQTSERAQTFSNKSLLISNDQVIHVCLSNCYFTPECNSEHATTFSKYKQICTMHMVPALAK